MLRDEWHRDGIEYEERLVDQDQSCLDEALDLGAAVPIIVYPDGRVEHGYKGKFG